MSKLRDDIGWMICHSWDCGDAPGDVPVLNTDKLKAKLERYVAEREDQLKRENAALREEMDVLRSAQPQLANLNAMGRRLRVPRKWLRDEAVEGRLPCVRAGAQFLFNVSVVERALAARAALSPQEAARG